MLTMQKLRLFQSALDLNFNCNSKNTFPFLTAYVIYVVCSMFYSTKVSLTSLLQVLAVLIFSDPICKCLHKCIIVCFMSYLGKYLPHAFHY